MAHILHSTCAPVAHWAVVSLALSHIPMSVDKPQDAGRVFGTDRGNRKESHKPPRDKHNFQFDRLCVAGWRAHIAGSLWAGWRCCGDMRWFVIPEDQALTVSTEEIEGGHSWQEDVLQTRLTLLGCYRLLVFIKDSQCSSIVQQATQNHMDCQQLQCWDGLFMLFQASYHPSLPHAIKMPTPIPQVHGSLHLRQDRISTENLVNT